MSRSVVRAVDLRPPHRIDDANFGNICETFGIVGSRSQEARDFLDVCVTVFAEAIETQSSLPSRKDDRLSIERAAREMRSAVRFLDQARGPAAREVLRGAGRRIGSLVSASWLQRRFPFDEDLPVTHYWPPDNHSSRSPARVSTHPVEVDYLSHNDRIFFATRRTRDVMAAILAEIAQALDDARQHIVQLPDGRKPLEYRNYLMAALAELWHRLEKRPTSGMRSKFGAFCESVFEAIGWPTEGVNAALSAAIATWREVYRH